MNAIICDRCRSIAAIGDEDKEVLMVRIFNSTQIIAVNKEYHLCTRCKKDFDKFMKNITVEVKDHARDNEV